MPALAYSAAQLFLAVTCCLLVLAGGSASSASQTYDASKVKSAYVFNFIRYVKWPNEGAITNLNIGFYGDDEAYYQSLLKMQGKQLRHFKLNVKKIRSLEKYRGLQVLIVGEDKSYSLSSIAKKTHIPGLLLISDKARDKKNTMLNFVSTEVNTLSFELNRYNILHAKLKVSPDILVLGGTELDIASVLKEMDDTISSSLAELKLQSETLALLQTEILNRESQLSSQQKELSQQGSKLFDQDQRLGSQKKALSTQATRLKKQEYALDKQLKKMQKQNEKLRKQGAELEVNKNKFTALKTNYADLNQELEESRTKLAENTESLLTLKTEIQTKEASISNLSKKISDRRASLQGLYDRQELQEKVIVEQEVEISEHLAEMAKQSSVIRTQYGVLVFAGIGLFSVLVTVGVIYHSSREKQRANKRLQENIRELAVVNQQLKDAQSQLVESEKMAALGGLVAGVAHEINTPLGVGVTAASLLSDRIHDFNKEYQSGELKRTSLEELLSDANESSGIIVRNLKRAGELVRNFKQVAVDQSSEGQRQFELKEYLQELSQSLHPQLKRKGHKVSIQSDEKIHLDSYPGVVAQVMTNLIMNSVLHGFKDKTGGSILIQLSLIKGQVYIDYQDDGVGLNEEQRAKVFEPFYTTVRGTGGSGLGMSISYNLVVNKLKGTIACIESSEGALFKIAFPAS